MLKKIAITSLVAICATLVLSTGAFSAVNVVSEDLQKAWNFSVENPKTNITSNYSIQTNTTYDIQYVPITAATEIYKNGAKFCRMHVVHNWGKWSVWVSSDSCRVICKDGFYGNQCASTTPSQNSCEDKSLINIFSLWPDKEKDIQGFYTHERDSIILGVVSTEEHEIEVRPVEIFSAVSNKIQSIGTRGQSFNLCAPGYKRDSQDRCVRTTACKCPSGQGFKGKDDTTCIKCDDTKKSGISSDGVCHLCKKGEIFNGTKCADAKKITKEKMRDCWQDPEFETCVKD